MSVNDMIDTVSRYGLLKDARLTTIKTEFAQYSNVKYTAGY